ncbi:TIGR01777 family oxidoreductase [Bacillus sonorensis]|uniref:TIGR01777 family oxidoreductase n=1 Tax=Bacillus sonorensis TaxID=119858 RepID=UPI001F015758|nr:TIGR01777 family oxidoreductase [Bacillus sonorensis]MCF7617074.1 TIGR01777 family oxidoreductase [Bacillus sonorensis]
MNIAIAGGTGFIGKHLIKALTAGGHHVYILSRKPAETEQKNISYVLWQNDGALPERELPEIEVWINLAGATIFGRWTEKTKAVILQSRLQSVKESARIIQEQKVKPNVYIQGSAVGIYGTSADKTFTETSSVSDGDFLSRTATAWEKEAKQIEALGIRTICMRFGVVLGKDGGALSKMALPYQWFAGGRIGSGRQWMSWIHIDDAVGIIQSAIQNSHLSGPVNVTAPNPVRMETFGKTVAKVKNRPHWLHVPEFALKTVLGEMSLLILKGQRAIPEKSLSNGYHFRYQTIEDALLDLLV